MRPRWLSLKPLVPQSWDEVTPEWMTAAIRSRHPDAVVGKVDILMRDDGTNRRARFGLSYASGTGPATVFVKAHAPSHRWVHFRNGNLFGESRLFAGRTPIPVDHPAVYLAVPDYPRLDFLLVMEDLDARGADCRDATRPMSVAQVAHAITGLAKLHSLYWGMTATSHPALKWVKPWTPSQGWQVGLRRRVPVGLERAGERLPPEIAAMRGGRVVDLWADYVSTLGDGGQTLLHGDAHIGNAYVLPGDEVGFLDWQVVRRGNWSQDVGYFLVGALTVEDRRAHERELLAIYRDALTLPTGQAPSVEGVWHRYRQSHAYGLAVWLSTLGTDGWQSRAVCEALVERYAMAFIDCATADALAKPPQSVN
ncbi:MAG: phosphotransferase [Sphingobium sp.]